MSLHTTAGTRFDSFDFYRTSYKKIREHEIEVNVLVPKGIVPGKHPVMIKWHGGGLTAGTAAYPKWFAAYLVSFLHHNSAIAILPNYRLTPEHTGDDILEDIASLHTWFTTSFPSYLASKQPSLEPDFSKVLISGESAGGWVALQSVLSLPRDTFKACLLQYPVLSTFPTSVDEVPPPEELDAFLKSIVPGTIISAAVPPERDLLAPMLRAHKRWGEFFGTGKHLMPDTRIEDDDAALVPTWIMHGKDDTNVPVEYTQRFIEKAKKRFPGLKIELVTPPGDHGFDGEMYEEEEPWLAEFLRGLEGDWLQ